MIQTLSSLWWGLVLKKIWLSVDLPELWWSICVYSNSGLELGYWWSSLKNKLGSVICIMKIIVERYLRDRSEELLDVVHIGSGDLDYNWLASAFSGLPNTSPLVEHFLCCCGSGWTIMGCLVQTKFGVLWRTVLDCIVIFPILGVFRIYLSSDFDNCYRNIHSFWLNIELSSYWIQFGEDFYLVRDGTFFQNFRIF